MLKLKLTIVAIITALWRLVNKWRFSMKQNYEVKIVGFYQRIQTDENSLSLW
jgi:hypothetical protein